MRKSRWKTWLPALFWMAVIFATSCRFIDRDAFLEAINRVLPGEGLRRVFTVFWDNGGGLAVIKGYHIAEFALLFLLAYRIMAGWFRQSAGRAVAWSAGFCVLFAISDEWHQTFVPGRGGTWVDVVIDCGGIGLAVWFQQRLSCRKAQHDGQKV